MALRPILSLPLLGLALAVSLGLQGCSSTPPPDAEAAPATPVAAASLGPLPDHSFYHLDATWMTQHEEAMQLADLRGQPTVLALVYAHCAYACPRLVHDMKRVASELGQPGVRYVLVSLDPERDTPAQLRSLQEGFALDDRWTLLQGDPRDVRRLAALLGVQYRTEADGEISHSNLIHTLDANGELVYQQEGLGSDPTPTVDALRTLLASR